MKINNEKEFFDKNYIEWTKSFDNRKLIAVEKSFDLLKINENNSVLDVGCGTGILYEILNNIPVSKYLGIDISKNMLKEFSKKYPNAKKILMDFSQKVKLNEKYDHIIIFDSIPHFSDLDILFQNVESNLKIGGKFSIIHSKTREGLKTYHKSINYNLGRDGIPKDEVIERLAKKYRLRIENIIDDDFFFFSCEKRKYIF